MGEKREAEESMSEWLNERRIQPTAAGFEDGRGKLQAKDCGGSLETGKGKEIDSFLDSRKNAALLTPILAQWDWHQTSNLQNC